MNLDESQRKTVAGWLAQGLKLSEIQNRLAAELGLKLTYMDVRLLVDDLKLTPKDAEPVKASPLTANAAAGAKAPATAEPAGAPKPAQGTGTVSVSVDQITRPGSVVSGKVTFSDGNRADWYLDQTGRLGLAPQKTGYRPPAADLQQFQAALESELSRLGF
jgi:transposase